jgi:hypothetical protein
MGNIWGFRSSYRIFNKKSVKKTICVHVSYVLPMIKNFVNNTYKLSNNPIKKNKRIWNSIMNIKYKLSVICKASKIIT